MKTLLRVTNQTKVRSPDLISSERSFLMRALALQKAKGMSYSLLMRLIEEIQPEYSVSY
jgi:hypothetical protein